MSYDLFFRPSAGRAMPTDDELERWFSGRGYEVESRQAMYANEDTGVYFLFDFPEDPEDGDADAAEDDGLEPLAPCLAFNLNYFRPSCFALEAAPELDALMRRFSFEVEDPQSSGMGNGPYTTDGFLRGWTAGNAFACQVMLREHDDGDLHTLPAATIQQVWRWNHGRRALQEELGDRIFVPRVSYIAHEGRVQTMSVWSDASAVLLPKVDVILIYRADLAPRRFLRRSKPHFCLCPYDTAEALLNRFPQVDDHPIPCRRLSYESPPGEVLSFVGERTPWKEELTSLSVDSVLDAELVAEARSAPPLSRA